LPSLGRTVRPSFGFGSSTRTPWSPTSQVSRAARPVGGSRAARVGLGARKRAAAAGGLGTEVGEGSAAYIAGQLGLLAMHGRAASRRLCWGVWLPSSGSCEGVDG
jgi:hypothetical protein